MSGYYEADSPRRQHKSHRSHRAPVYQEEEIIESRTSRPQRQMDLVRRPRDDSTSSTEEVRRDFAPGDSAYIQRRTVVRDKYPPARARSVDNDNYYDNYSRGSRHSDGGRRSRRYDERGSRRGRYESDSDSESQPRSRRKSLGEQALAALGLGGAAAAMSGKDRDRARSRSRRRGDYSPERSRSRSEDRAKKIQQAVKSAAVAAAVEAFRSRKEPGGWQGQGKRVLTAAIGAAGINGAIDKDPNHHSTRHTLEAALGGIASNRLINGARSRSRSRGRNSHGKEESNLSGAGGLAAASGLAALGVKAFNDYRNKSRDRSRNRRHSDDYSDGSRSPAPRKRSNSVSAFITRGLDKGKAALGIENDRRDSGRSSHGGYDDRLSRQGGPNDYYARPRGGGFEEDSQPREHDTSTDYSSEEEMKKQHKMHTKELITAGFATVATVHAGHTIYQTREKRMKRQKRVREGTMSPEEARKLEKKGYLQDAASVGIAALGIKSAYSEWKETKESRDEYKEACKELEAKRQRRREKSLMAQRGQGEGRRASAGYRRSDPNLSQSYYYRDDNPYGAGRLPPPPMGPYH